MFCYPQGEVNKVMLIRADGVKVTKPRIDTRVHCSSYITAFSYIPNPTLLPPCLSIKDSPINARKLAEKLPNNQKYFFNFFRLSVQTFVASILLTLLLTRASKQ